MPASKAPSSVNAGLFITGKDIDPAKITRILGLKPSSTFARGESLPDCDKKRAQALWALESRGKIRSRNPLRHVEWLLRRLDKARSALVRLHKRTEMQVVIRVSWPMPGPQGTLRLERKLVRRIARLKLPLEVLVCAEQAGAEHPGKGPE